MRGRMLGFVGFLVIVLGVMVSWAAPSKQADAFDLFLADMRSDLELAANEALGEGVRPDSWTFNTDPGTETMLPDLWYDNEQLADRVFGENERPDAWFGATTNNPQLLARNVRHDLELTADEVFGENQRPDDWTGAPPIYRCDRTLQNIVRLLETFYEQEQPEVTASTGNYCDTLRFSVEGDSVPTIYAESEPPDPDTPAFRVRVNDLTLAVRGDLERLANELLGVNTRPDAWIGNTDPDSDSLGADINTDLDTLADTALGDSKRPENWQRFLPAAPGVSFRNLRYNLEQLANATLGADTRPNGWQGTDPQYRCEPFTQHLTFLLRQQYDFTPQDEVTTGEDFCRVLEFTANNVAENPPRAADSSEQREDEDDEFFSAESRRAFSYLDTAATQYMGVMPWGTEFRAWYRNYQGSTLMYVTGNDFGVFIDRRWTTMDSEVFNRLPNLDDVKPLTFCDANWCNGPRNTPTPTGGGPLVRLHQDNETPVPQQLEAEQAAEEGGKTQVSWDHIRVNYLLDRPEQGVAQVTLEICEEPQQVSCEPVTRVFNNNLSAPKPVLSQQNGLNVYELPYGYNENLLVEGATLVSPDVWISDPTIR